MKKLAKAIWNDEIIAESNDYKIVEGNYYFPPKSVKKQYLKDSQTRTTCGWKGIASYFNLEVKGKKNKDAAWYYPDPKSAAKEIKNYIAFWKGVTIQQ